MNPNTPDKPGGLDALERASGELLRASADAVDGRIRSRLNQARHAALAELAAGARPRPFRIPVRQPAARHAERARAGVGCELGERRVARLIES